MKSLMLAGGKLIAGTGFAQVIGLLAMPIITRIYSPDEFGLYSAALVLVGLISILATMQLQHAIVLPKLDLHAYGLFYIACYGSFIGGFLVFLISWLSLYIWGHPIIISFLWAVLTGIAVFASGVNQLIQGLAIRAAAFGSVGTASVMRAVSAVVVQIVLGMEDAGAAGLLAGYVVSEISCAYLIWWRLTPKDHTKSAFRKIKWHRGLLNRYGDFVKFATPQEMLNSGSQGLPVIMLGLYYGETAAGYYAFAMRILMAPVQLVGNAIRQVLYKRSASQSSDMNCRLDDFRMATLILGGISLLFAALFAPFFPSLFGMIFGTTWIAAGEYSVWLAFWVAFLLCNIPSSIVFRVLRKQDLSLKFNIAILLTRVVSLLIGGHFLSIYWTIASYSIIGVIMNIAYMAIAYGLLSSNIRLIVK